MIHGCSGIKRTVFLHPEYNFGMIERVAVIPFVNLTNDAGMGEFAARLFITELLSKNAFDVVEIGEVVHELVKAGKSRDSELSTEELKKIAGLLNAQALIFGSVGESSSLRTGSISSHILGMQVSMVEAETGVTVWSANIHTSGPGFLARIFGVGEQSRGNSARKAVKKAVKTLVR
jgi:TolB-like protein